MKSGVILASGSPQRTRLLDQLGIAHEVIAADIDETPGPGETAEALAARLARAKAEAIAGGREAAVVLGSDTVVALGPRLYGKPADAAEAEAMLASLAGRCHRVVSSVALSHGGDVTVRSRTSHVTLRDIEACERRAYVASGEPMGKAGGYAIQGLGAVFIAGLDGSYSAVMGLPLFETAALLRDAGLDVLGEP